MRRLGAKRRFDARFERVLFALSANRALAPSSKLAAADWICNDVHIDGLSEIGDDVCYRAMDWLLETCAELERAVYSQRASAQPRGRPAVFQPPRPTSRWTRPTSRSAATSVASVRATTLARRIEATDPKTRTTEEEQAASKGPTASRRTHRDDLPQIVDRDGGHPRRDPRARCGAGRATQATRALIRQVRDDMREWNLARIVWVADRGFASATQPAVSATRSRATTSSGRSCVAAPRPRDAALSRQGRYQKVRDNLRGQGSQAGQGLG